MATVQGTSFGLTATVIDDDTLSFAGPHYVSSLDIGGTHYVYVTGDSDNAVQVFTLSEDGLLTAVGAIGDTALSALGGASGIRAFYIDDTPFVLVSGRDDQGITMLRATETAPYLSVVTSVFDFSSVNHNLNGVWAVEVVTVPGGTFAFAASPLDDGLSAFSVSSTGRLTNVQNLYDAENLNFALNDPYMLRHFSLGDGDYLAVAGRAENGISIFEINQSSGALTFVSSVFSATSLQTPWQIEATEIDGKAYLYVGLEAADAITVLSFNGNSLTEIQTISSSRLDGANGISLVEVGNATLVAAHNFYANTVEVFEVNTDALSPNLGELSPMQTLTDPGAQSSRGGGFATVDGTTFFLSIGDETSAVSVFEVGGLDDVLDGTQLADTMFGFGGDDIIYAFAGTDEIDGGAGTDIIYAGSGADTVFASEGNDRTYAGSGYDTFDVSEFSSFGEGLTIDLFNEQMLLPDGTFQVVAHFERVFATQFSDTLFGNEAVNDLYGGTGDDELYGFDGNDFLRGQEGVDKIIAGEGDDYIDAGAGDDVNVNGGDGNDRLFGRGGFDALFGGAGDDDIDGGTEDDLVYGNAGNDTLRGGDGDDDVRGGDGNDALMGGLGNDFMLGEGGDDILSLGPGNDLASGGAGADIFEFRTVASGGGGFNTVQDFTDGIDRLDFSDYAFTFDDITVVSRSWGTRLDMPDGQLIALSGFGSAGFDTSDVIL